MSDVDIEALCDSARDATEALAKEVESSYFANEDLERQLAEARSEFAAVERLTTAMAEAIGWETDGDTWVDKAKSWRENPDDIPGLYVERTALRRVVRKLAMLNPGHFTDDDYCVFCGDYLTQHEPDCVWALARALVRDE